MHQSKHAPTQVEHTEKNILKPSYKEYGELRFSYLSDETEALKLQWETTREIKREELAGRYLETGARLG